METTATDRAVRAAALTLHEGRRLDLGVLATQLGISRVTLHRRVGTREALMGEALWLLAEETFRDGLARWEAEPVEGPRSFWLMRHVRERVAQDPGLRTLLDDEPVATIRLLTDPHGRVQPRTVDRVARALQADVDAGALAPFDVASLAHAVVRLSESFLFADVVAHRAPDLAACTELVEAVLLAAARPA